jgi:hypothetical protein
MRQRDCKRGAKRLGRVRSKWGNDGLKSNGMKSLHIANGMSGHPTNRMLQSTACTEATAFAVVGRHVQIFSIIYIK